MVHKMFIVVPIAALALGSSTACATKGFVRTSVGQVNEKVDSLGRSLEETQERTRQNEAKITEVDQRAQAAAGAASQAAQSARAEADKAGTAALAANKTATTASAKADEVDKAVKRLMFEVVLSEDQGNFAFGMRDLPAEAKARLDEMITQLKADPKGAYFEIEGHTDSIGPEELNDRLGLERAETVKRYLYEQHQIPLHKMNAISFGEAKPAADNKTRVGREKNRRVVIKVLA